MRTLIFSALAVAAGIYAEKKFNVSDRIAERINQFTNNDPEEEEIEDEDDFKAI